ncbi:MAG: AAA family ATPase [Henriciella sp.]|mmetsp:Transcript_27107/g.34914  ORF Transcript_27107/g.34914 Transcript_27107/m.34914 type:complete len:466 (+) Transcript_27107:52-1449(+)
MSNDNALFEDDFDMDFEDDFDSALTSVIEDNSGLEGVDLDAPQKDLSAFDPDDAAGEETPITLSEFEDGGHRAIPAISAMAFCESSRTVSLMEAVASDRRMAQATLQTQEGGLEAAIAYLQENQTPNLLILESSAANATMIAQIDELASHCDEGVQVMVIGNTNDIGLYRQLMARGVSEYLVPPVPPVQIVRSISQLFADPDAPFVGKSISVLGAKGGVGASTIAHNLAWSLSESAQVSTALIDLDLSFGTTALDFNHENQQTVADALLAPERVDDAVVSKLLAKVTDRLSLFTAPATVSQIMDIPAASYTSIIDTVRRVMPYVVLDLPHAWNEWTYQTLLSSDEVILVCQPDLASLRNGKNIIDELKAQRPNDVPPKLVVNMTGVPKRPEIPTKDFAAAIEVEPSIILPFDPQLFGTASNNGQMISETDATADASVSIDQLSGVLTGREITPQTKSLLSKLLGK